MFLFFFFIMVYLSLYYPVFEPCSSRPWALRSQHNNALRYIVYWHTFILLLLLSSSVGGGTTTYLLFADLRAPIELNFSFIHLRFICPWKNTRNPVAISAVRTHDPIITWKFLFFFRGYFIFCSLLFPVSPRLFLLYNNIIISVSLTASNIGI